MTNVDKVEIRPRRIKKSIIQFDELLKTVSSVSSKKEAEEAWMKLINLMKEKETVGNWTQIAFNMVKSILELKDENKVSSKCRHHWERQIGAAMIASIHERKTNRA